MLVARREITTRSLDQPESPAGRGLKHASAAFIAKDGMYAGFAGAKTGAILAKGNQPSLRITPCSCMLQVTQSSQAINRGALNIVMQ